MKTIQKKSIGVLMGGLSPEREVSLATGRAVQEALQGKGLNATAIDVDGEIQTKLRDARVDLAFVALHGNYGEDGCIQGVLEYLKIPYTGPGVLGSALAFNKAVTKQLLVHSGVPTPEFEILYKDEYAGTGRSLDLPLVVKPSDQGSSFGVGIVREETEWESALDEAFAYSNEVVVERFIEGRLLTVGMNGDRPLSIVEIKPKSGFYDYEAKYTPGKTEYLCPAPIEPKAAERCRETAVRVYRTLRGRGFCRVDFILDSDGTPQVLEMNTVPGLTPTSLLPMSAKESGLEFADLAVEMLKTARLDYASA